MNAVEWTVLIVWSFAISFFFGGRYFFTREMTDEEIWEKYGEYASVYPRPRVWIWQGK